MRTARTVGRCKSLLGAGAGWQPNAHMSVSHLGYEKHAGLWPERQAHGKKRQRLVQQHVRQNPLTFSRGMKEATAMTAQVASTMGVLFSNWVRADWPVDSSAPTAAARPSIARREFHSSAGGEAWRSGRAGVVSFVVRWVGGCMAVGAGWWGACCCMAEAGRICG